MSDEQTRLAVALLRVGTEVLRTGGGISLTSAQCNVLLDRLAELEHAAAAARKWAKAWERTAECRDEFGWDKTGAHACAEWQEAEDTAALALRDALARLDADGRENQ
jgi:hypothetical protein